MEIFYTRKAEEDFERLPFELQRRIAIKMRFFASEHDPLKFAKHLTDAREGEFRFRVGDYRIFFDVIRGKIFVLSIKHRSKSYE